MKATVLNNNLLTENSDSSINHFDFIFPKNGFLIKNKIKYQNDLASRKTNVKDYPDISFKSHQVLLGSLLGDMYLKKEFKNCHIEETHSINQKDYLEWKYKNLLESFNLILYQIDDTLLKIRGKTYRRNTQVRLRSRVSERLNFYHDLFYKNGIKSISLPLLNQLDILALAVWYCDDGYYDPVNRTAQLHTEGFSIKENEEIKKWFSNKWAITVNFKKDPSKKRVCLRLSVRETNKFLELVKSNIFEMPQSMWYKLGHVWEGNTEIINKAKINKSKRTKLYQSREAVKVRRRKQAREYYSNYRENILKIKSEYQKTEKYKKYVKEYNQRLKVIERRRERERAYRQNEDYRMKRLIYQREYRKRPEVKEKIRNYNLKAREKQRRGDRD